MSLGSFLRNSAICSRLYPNRDRSIVVYFARFFCSSERVAAGFEDAANIRRNLPKPDALDARC
jgi:hypothetical protein